MSSRRRWATLLAAAMVLLLVTPASAYVPLTLGFDPLAGATLARWQPGSFPVPLTVSSGLSVDIAGSSELPAL
ncbi:MAG: hypothetical protein ACE5HV_06605, partial [Acidobacteriota bacterium]